MANAIKGITVEIGGDTTKLGKALEDVNNKGRDLSSELGQINKLLKFDPGNAELLAQKQKILADAVENTKEKLNTLKTAEAQVQEQFKRGEVSEEQVRALEREIISVTQKLGSYEKAVQETADEIQELGKNNKTLKGTISDQKKALEKLKEEYVDVASSQGKNSTEAKELKSQIKKLSTELGTNEKKLKDVEESVEKVGKEFNNTGDHASKFGEKMKKVGSVASTALAGIGAAAGAAVAGLANATVEAAEYADNMLTMSTVTGVSTDDLQAFNYASELVDVSVETLTKSMAKNIKSMKSATDGSKLYVEAYDKLGVSVTDANGNMRDGQEVYWECIDALGKIENETERDALAMQLFGRSAQELNPLIEAGSEKMNELTQEAKEVGAVMSEDALSALGAFDDSVQRLKGSAGAAKNSLGSVLLPELQMLTDTGTDLLTDFTKKLNESGGGFDGFLSVIDDMSDDIVETVSSLIGQLLSTIGDLLPTVSNIGIKLIASLATSFVSSLPQLLDVVAQVVVSLLSSLSEAVPKLASVIASTIPKLVSVIQSALPQIISAVVLLVSNLVASIDQILPPLISAIGPLIMAVCGALLDNLPVLLNAIISLAMMLVDYVDDIVLALLPMIPLIITALLQTVADMLPVLLDAIINLVILLATQVLPAIIGEIFKMIPQILGAILSGLGQVLVSLGKWAGSLLVRLGQWLGKMFSAIGQWLAKLPGKAREGATNFANSFINFIKNLPERIGYFLGMIIGKVASWVVNMAKKAKEAGTQFINNTINFFKTLPSKISTWLQKTISNVSTWGKNLASKAKTAAKDLVNNLVNGVKSLPDKMKNVGKNLVEGLWNGIKNMTQWVKDKIRGFSDGVLQGIKDFFKVKSPSQKMRDEVGKMIALGLAEGITENADSPLSAMSDLSNDLLGEADALNGATINRKLSATFDTGKTSALTDGTLMAKLDMIYERLAHLQVILDSGTLVGEILDPIDAGLAEKQLLSARGV